MGLSSPAGADRKRDPTAHRLRYSPVWRCSSAPDRRPHIPDLDRPTGRRAMATPTASPQGLLVLSAAASPRATAITVSSMPAKITSGAER